MNSLRAKTSIFVYLLFYEEGLELLPSKERDGEECEKSEGRVNDGVAELCWKMVGMWRDYLRGDRRGGGE